MNSSPLQKIMAQIFVKGLSLNVLSNIVSTRTLTILHIKFHLPFGLNYSILEFTIEHIVQSDEVGLDGRCCCHSYEVSRIAITYGSILFKKLNLKYLQFNSVHMKCT